MPALISGGRQDFPGKNSLSGRYVPARSLQLVCGLGLGLLRLHALFFLIHALVGLLDELIKAISRIFPEIAQSKTARIGGLTFLAHTFQLEEEDILTDLAADKDEFIAADAENIAAAEMAGKDAAHALYVFVAFFVTVGVVYALETVQVDEDYADLGDRSFGKGFAGSKVGVPVAEPCEGISQTERAQLVSHAGLGDGVVDEVGKRVQKGQIVLSVAGIVHADEAGKQSIDMQRDDKDALDVLRLEQVIEIRRNIPDLLKVVDGGAVGAGDAYRGGLLYGLTAGLDPVQSARIASVMGALKVSTLGVQNYTTTLDDVRMRFEALWGKAPF